MSGLIPPLDLTKLSPLGESPLTKACIEGLPDWTLPVAQPPAESVERQIVLMDKDGKPHWQSSRCRITPNDDGTLKLEDLSGDGGWIYWTAP